MFAHGMVGTLLASIATWNVAHTHVVFVVVFTLIGGLGLGNHCLFVCSWQLVVAGYYYYSCLSDNQQQLYTELEEVGGLPLQEQVTVSGILWTYRPCAKKVGSV